MDIWREHGLKIVVAFAVVVAIAVAGSALDGRTSAAARGRPPLAPTGSATPSPTPLGSHPYEGPGESATPVTPVPTAPSQRPAVGAAVRTFIAGYLPFSYGQRTAVGIADVTAIERVDLAANPPQVPSRVRRRHPRVLAVALRPYAAGEWAASVRVSDGKLTYTVPLVLGDLPGGWQVMAIQE